MPSVMLGWQQPFIASVRMPRRCTKAAASTPLVKKKKKRKKKKKKVAKPQAHPGLRFSDEGPQLLFIICQLSVGLFVSYKLPACCQHPASREAASSRTWRLARGTGRATRTRGPAAPAPPSSASFHGGITAAHVALYFVRHACLSARQARSRRWRRLPLARLQAAPAASA